MRELSNYECAVTSGGDFETVVLVSGPTNREELKDEIIVGGMIMGSVGAGALAFYVGYEPVAVAGAACCGLIVVPIGLAFGTNILIHVFDAIKTIV